MAVIRSSFSSTCKEGTVGKSCIYGARDLESNVWFFPLPISWFLKSTNPERVDGAQAVTFFFLWPLLFVALDTMHCTSSVAAESTSSAVLLRGWS